MSILMVASEAVPYAKTGGLADVVGALPGALARLGHHVTLVMPRYRDVGPVGTARHHLDLDLGGRRFKVGLVEVDVAERYRVVFLDCDALYDREGVYGHAGTDHSDNAVRYGVLCRAACEYGRQLEVPPSVVHAHDWQAALVPVLLRTRYATDPAWRGVPVVLTIHNLAYQGLFPPDTMRALDLPPSLFSIEGIEYWNQVSFLKGGINFADAITTVSQTYARQILTPAHGEGFDGILTQRRDRLSGIVNGIDSAVWDPDIDPWLPAPYSAADVGPKREVKRAVLDRFGLPSDDVALTRPVVGMVSRMVDQKGLDLIFEARTELMALPVSWVILGTGDPRYEAMWRALALAHPERVGTRIGFDEPLAHLIEGGSDLFLMPSRFEPCGLNQMYSMRYGTVPVVRATGGLADTVRDVQSTTGPGTGFVFEGYTASAMLAALHAALATFDDRPRWAAIQHAGMTQDFSWTASAAAYVQEYR
ncbi:MAG: glycogen synthase GlgA, partial [bacterium]